jgi:uncharacterized glyoxalase superfamily protein PhnB
MGLGPVIPTLAVASVSGSIAFYTGKLGFEVQWAWSDARQFEVGDAEPEFACIGCGEAGLFLSSSGGGEASCVFLELPLVEEVNELAAKLDGQVEIVAPLGDRDWGSREFVVKDPDGHELRFSCPLNRTRSQSFQPE